MKRRVFTKASVMASIALSTNPLLGCSGTRENKSAFDVIDRLTLKGFDNEEEESPALVSDGNGQMWLFTLRRMGYPKNSVIFSPQAFFEV